MGLVLRVQHVSVGIVAGEGERAWEFYIGALGLREKPRPLGLQDVPVIWFDAGDDESEIHLLETEGYVAPQGNHLCLEVDDLEAMRARMAQHGVATREAQPIDNRPRFNVSDPFGNGIELTELLGAFTPVEEE
jgi:catechol 2,3-dioxygenase-like lactoylglutathione lyase family enzyme